MPVIGYEERIAARFTSKEKKKLKKIIKKNREKYYNESHFLRCAVIKLIRDEGVKNVK